MKFIMMLPFLVLLFLIPAQAEESDECIFTGFIQKSWVMFGERPWVTGFVINCDDDNIEYHLKDFVHWQIKDANGDPVIEEIYNRQMSESRKEKYRQEYDYTKYKGIDDVYRGYGVAGANADTTES